MKLIFGLVKTILLGQNVNNRSNFSRVHIVFLFVAFVQCGTNSRAVGFVQLYPVFSSLSMRPQWILSDLYVAPEARKQGAGAALMNRARELARATGADGLMLETAVDNLTAQKLYEELGYKRDEEFFRYFLAV